MSHLANYPKLEAWYHARSGGIEAGRRNPLAETIVMSLCKSMSKGRDQEFYCWEHTMSLFLTHATQPTDNYRELEELLSRLGFCLNTYTSEMGYLAFSQNCSERYYRLISELADTTYLISFRFLQAWTAFNSDRFSLCIELCDRIQEPFAAIYTLKGQALFESGQTEQAVVILEKAVDLDPEEILAWFQLAKVEWALGHMCDAWEALQQCVRIDSNSAETAMFLAEVALFKDSSSAQVNTAWKHLVVHLQDYREHPVFSERLMRLALRSGDKERTRQAVNNISWKKVLKAMILQKSLGFILHKLGEFQWYDLSSQLLQSAELNENQVKGL